MTTAVDSNVLIVLWNAECAEYSSARGFGQSREARRAKIIHLIQVTGGAYDASEAASIPPQAKSTTSATSAKESRDYWTRISL